MRGGERGKDMKKYIKRLALLLAAVCVPALVACSKAVTTTGHTHSFGSWVVISAADCTKYGLEERVCACGEKESQAIPALGHGASEIRNARPASCTESGYSGDSYCSVCGEKLESGTEIAATGHNFGEWSVKTAASCTEQGLTERVCACGEKETQQLPATGHTFGEWTVTIAADALHDGLEERVCACGEKESREIPASGELTLSLEIAWENNELIVALVLSGGAGVTNGKVTVSYDAEALSLEDIEMCLPCGLYDINTQTAGLLSITWVGSDTSETQTLLKLRLTPGDGITGAAFTAQADEVYVGETPLTAAPAAAAFAFEAFPEQGSSQNKGGTAK